jgi:hypothetical protein
VVPITIAPRPEAEPRPERGRWSRRWLLRALALAAGIALYAYLLRRSSPAELARTLARTDAGALALCLALGLLATALRAARYASLRRVRGRPVELYGAFALIRLLGFAMPFHAGDLAAMWLLKRRGLAPSLAELAPTWIMLRIGDLAAVGLLLTLALTLATLEGTARWLGGSLLGAGALATLLLGTARRWIPAAGERLANRSAWLRSRLERLPALAGAGDRRAAPRSLGGSLALWLRSRLERFTAGLEGVSDRGAALRTIGWSLALWAVMIGTAAAAQVAVRAPLSWEQNLATSAAVLGLSLAPVHAPLGIGTQDAAWYGVLIAAGVPGEAAVPLALGARLLLVATVLVDGLVGIGLLALASPRPGAR